MSLRIGNFEIHNAASVDITDATERGYRVFNLDQLFAEFNTVAMAQYARLGIFGAWERAIYRTTHRAHRGRKRHVKRWVAQQGSRP